MISMTGVSVTLTKLPAPPMPEERKTETLYEAADIVDEGVEAKKLFFGSGDEWWVKRASEACSLVVLIV